MKRRPMHLSRIIFELAGEALKPENRGSFSGFFLLPLPIFLIIDIVLLPFADWKNNGQPK